MRSIAAGFLITSDLMNTKIGNLSEGQKGLVAFARLVLAPGALFLTNRQTTSISGIFPLSRRLLTNTKAR